MITSRALGRLHSPGSGRRHDARNLSRHSPAARPPAQHGYVLLETVVATGLLVVGLAVIGAQVQRADMSIREMERELRAMMLAEQQFAELDLGLIELDSVDEIQEEDFGRRYPDYGWRLTIDETAIERMFLLKLEVLHHIRDEEYREDAFEFEEAETLFTVYTIRTTPQPVNFGEDFGLSEDELIELSEKFGDLGIEGMDPEEFDLAVLGKIDFEELLEALPLILDAFGMDFSQMAATLPPDLLRRLKEEGLFGVEGAEGEEEKGFLDGLRPGGGS